MNWLGVTARILPAAALAAFIGWLYGYPVHALLLFFIALVVLWIFQMRKVQRWFQNPSVPPPDAFGFWGELLAHVYVNEKKGRATENQLKANVKYLQDSFGSMRDGVVMVDGEGLVSWFNESAAPLLGLRHPEDVGQRLTNLVRSPQLNQYFLEDDFSRPLEYNTDEENSKTLRVDITRFGKAEKLLFVRDISESVRLEQMRRDFVANVSHELRTPLTVISGYLGTFLSNLDELPDPYHKPLRQMDQQAGRMENLLKDLLWLSRIESERQEEKRELVDMAGLLQEVREEFTDIHPERTIQLESLCQHKVLGDYRQLYSAVGNLVSNAIKYSDSSEPVVIRWYSQGNKCIVEVIDRGVGVDPVHIPRLTERFYRVDDSRSSSTGGTGLGLAIVKHVVAAHGGEFKIQSRQSEGSTFALLFPEGASSGT